MKQNAEKARALGPDELTKQLREGAEQMFRLRFQLGMGMTDGVKKVRELRKERARLLTVQREREIEAKTVAAAPAAKPAAKVVKAAPKPSAKKPAKPAKAVAETATKPAVKKAAAAKPAVKKAAAKKAPAEKTKASKGKE